MAGSELTQVVIGELGRAHGVTGELRGYATGRTLATLALGASVNARRRDGTEIRLTLVDRRDGPGALILRFGEVHDRDAAARLTGAVLSVPEASLPQLEEPDEFFVRDLIGYTVRLAPSGAELGRVVAVHDGAANDALEVDRHEAPPLLIPFTHDAIVHLDVAGRTMDVRDSLFGGHDA